MKRVLIIEPHCTGHRPTYVRWLIEYFAGRGTSVVLAAEEGCAAHVQLAPLMRVPGARLELLPIEAGSERSGARPSNARLLSHELAYFRVFRRAHRTASRRGPIDAVVLPYLDYCAHAIALFGSPFARTPWCAITMRWKPGARAGLLDHARAWAVRRILAIPTLRALFSISPASVRFAAGLSGMQRARLRYLPDPAEIRHLQSRSASRAALSISDAALVVLVFGTIDERKGLAPLLDAILSGGVPDNLCVLVAGRQSASMRVLLASEPYARLLVERRVIVRDEFLDDLAQGTVFGASDIVWLGYVGHRYMSGVMVLAGIARLPVIACDEGEIGEITRSAGLGPVVTVEDPRAVATALTSLADARARAAYGAAAYAHFRAHEPRAFGDAVLSALTDGEPDSRQL